MSFTASDTDHAIAAWADTIGSHCLRCDVLPAALPSAVWRIPEKPIVYGIKCDRTERAHNRRINAMSSTRGMLTVISVLALLSPTTVTAQPVGRITGVGGVFVVSKDPKALAAWYRDVLGIPMEPWGGAILRYDVAGHPPMVVWNAMPKTSDELTPSKRDFMINLAVDNLDAFIRKLREKHVFVLKTDAADPNGKFAWIMDPDGTKIELWEPKTK